MYYVIETNYVGPNPDQAQNIDADTIEIRTSPEINNSSQEECIKGWCGTTNDWDVYAHGQYTSIKNARAAVATQFGQVRDVTLINCSSTTLNDGVVEIYKKGSFEPMDSEVTAAWAYESIKSDIKADTPDDRIAALAKEYRADANREGYSLSSAVEDMMLERRRELRDEL